MTPRRAWLAVAAGMLWPACSSGVSDQLTVADPWVRPTAPFANTAAFYASIENASNRDDILVSMTSTRCEFVEIHETTVTGAVSSMAPVDPDGLSLGAGERVELEPGGLHGMCLGLAEPLVEGAMVDLRLNFARSGSIDLEVPVEQR